MATIVSNYDGPLYLVVAKSLYNPDFIQTNFQFNLPTEYYAAHFPLFPLLIRAFSFLAGYPYSMLFVTIASSFIAIFFFNKLIRFYVNKKDALWMTFIFSIFPARWLIVRSVGSAEPLFIGAIIASLYYFKRKKYLWAGIWGFVAQLTKSPAILLFAAYFVAIIYPSLKNLALDNFAKWVKNLNLVRYYPIFFIPLGLIAIFSLYSVTQNDFFAYFKSGDNIHLFFLPFSIFNYSAPWVGTYWLEEIIFVYLLGAIGVIRLFRQKLDAIAWFVGIFFFSTLFVAHRDLIRYSLPLVPFLLVAYSDVLVKKDFKIAFSVIVIPIYLFSLAYISQNTMPISNWAPFL